MSYWCTYNLDASQGHDEMWKRKFQKVTYCMISLKWHSQNDNSGELEKSLVVEGLEMVGEKGCVWLLNGQLRGDLRDNGIVLYLDCGWDYRNQHTPHYQFPGLIVDYSYGRCNQWRELGEGYTRPFCTIFFPVDS